MNNWTIHTLGVNLERLDRLHCHRALDIDVVVPPFCGWFPFKSYWLVPIECFPEVCLDLMQGKRKDYTLHFELPDRKQERTQACLLDCLATIPSKGATITGNIANSVKCKLISDMKRTPRTIDEVIDQIRDYRDKGDEQLALGDLQRAEVLYGRGHAIYDCDEIRGLRRSNSHLLQGQST